MHKKEDVKFLEDFYRDKKVLITGIHGFKGAWLAMLLHELGAEVVGLGLQAEDNLLFPLLRLEEVGIKSYEQDICDRSVVELIKTIDPDVVFHLAAQALVSVGYDDPYQTYMSNAMGTLNVMDGIRELHKKVSFLCVTTDKCYKNVEKEEGYVETDELMGLDPYSSSKSCAELIAYSYNESFFKKLPPEEAIIMSTVRAGNVIGGGDFALNRIIPDLVRGVQAGKPVMIRNFDSVRPYQHVLDALYAYVLLAGKQWDQPELAQAYNIGPNDESIMKTRALADYFAEHAGLEIIDGSEGRTFHEATLLTLDSGKFRRTFSWEPVWGSREAMLGATYDWYMNWITGAEPSDSYTLSQVRKFLHG